MLLRLALALVAQSAAGAPAETVAAVRLDVPPRTCPASPFVDLRPGNPCADAVRRTVELLFATGEFDDVVAEP
jgi:hypothetical protein